MRQQDKIRWVLWVGLLLQGLALLKIAYVDGTPIGTTLFMSWGWAESTMLAVEHGAAWVVLACVLLLARWRSFLCAAPIAIWFFLIAVATFTQGGTFGAPYALFAHSARYAFALLIVLFAHHPARGEQVARSVIAITFFAHGLEAWALHPRFVDYIIAGFDNVLGFRIEQAVAEWMLRAIAVIDIVVALLVVLKRWKTVVVWMAIWGAATASSRMIQLGFAKWPATLLRAAHVAIPMALYLWWRRDTVDVVSEEDS